MIPVDRAALARLGSGPWTVLLRLVRAVASRRSSLLEQAGIGLAPAGIHEVYPPAAPMFVVGALLLVAQGLDTNP